MKLFLTFSFSFIFSIYFIRSYLISVDTLDSTANGLFIMLFLKTQYLFLSFLLVVSSDTSHLSTDSKQDPKAYNTQINFDDKYHANGGSPNNEMGNKNARNKISE
jgi:hypothetical protein